ncbi:hypothetical protein K2173_004438 [Erythroxylum novogranatense]|uniref:Receptor-interacting protein n=1 Tax=Erythroxylum novogranatense TaxID=1862640 RepID=A0AAV8T4H5_9ROSI|nr:hypothetical protein K2173_004438 [Erythroxylum novogranatense]
MISVKLCKGYYQSSFLLQSSELHKGEVKSFTFAPNKVACRRKLVVTGCGGQESGKKPERPTFLSLEEAGLVEMSGLSTHERFLCRLTISSLNLLRVISEQEGCPIEELNAGRVCDWFVKDKLKREQDIDSAVLQWNDSEFQF